MGFTFQEMLIVGIIAIVLFGRDLPKVARTAGQQYAKLRKTLHDLSSQVNLHEIYDPRPTSAYASSTPKRIAADNDDHDEATAPRFQPPPAEPAAEENSNSSAGTA